jgi:hypothetical protein
MLVDVGHTSRYPISRSVLSDSCESSKSKMHAPTVTELLNDVGVQQALEKAWDDSTPDDSLLRHEEGGWIFIDTKTGDMVVRRASSGAQTSLDLSEPPLVFNAVVVATFHTHPNPSADGWEPGPSSDDTESAWLAGVPCLIRADDGIHTTGPISRRGGLTGGPGYPP